MAVRLLALGDSFTIGTGASSEAAAFPNLIARRLEAASGIAVEVTNPAVNGYTTEDLIRTELGHLSRLRPDLVSLLIGANDVVQGRSPAQYTDSLLRIHAAIGQDAGRSPGAVTAISQPDWSVTPGAAELGEPAQFQARIAEFNDIARHHADLRGWLWVDLTEVSRSAGRPGWLASDGLHPGDEQHAAWAEVIWGVCGVTWTRLAQAGRRDR